MTSIHTQNLQTWFYGVLIQLKELKNQIMKSSK